MAQFSHSRRNLLRWSAGIGLTCVFGVGADGALFEPYRFSIERVDVILERLPAAFNDLTIAQLSDFHCDSQLSEYVISAAVERTNELMPDLVVLTGDYVSSPPVGSWARAASFSEPCARLLSGLRAPLGVVAVLGNHDYIGAMVVRRSLERCGITVLVNERVAFQREGAQLWVCGLDDVMNGQPDLPHTLAGIPTDEATIMVVHEPDYADLVRSFPVDLQISAHSHGGQVNFPLLGPLYLPRLARKYPWGLRVLGSLTLYTNRGIGTVTLPIRFNCPPEITLLKLRGVR